MTALNYTAGTVSLTNGSAVVTGVGTAWQIALIVGGTIYVEAAGNPLPIDSVDSDTQITAAIAWAGATGAYNYVLRRSTTYDEQVAKNAEIFARLVAELEAGTIWKYDASGDTAGKAFYDTRPKGFSYLDTSGAQPALWVKASNDEADWAGPFSYGVGPVGPSPSLSFSPITTGEPGTPASVDVTGSGPYNLAFTIPAGLTGIRWRGAYSAGTSYLERDSVRDNGSAWIALQDTIGNAPPVLPVTANAFWELLSAKGVDGTGTGDVVGPASSTDGGFAVFDGTSGKLLKLVTASDMKVALALTSDDVSFDNSAAALPGSPVTAQAAIEAVVEEMNSAAASGQNDAVFALEIADLKGARLGMAGGIADPFDDETGVDTGASVNQAYDAGNDWYKATQLTSMIPQETGTAFGDMTRLGGLAVAFNGSTAEDIYTCAASAVNTATVAYIGKDYGASPKKVGSCRVFSPSAYGFDGTNSASTITLTLRGKNGSPPTSATDGTSLGTTSFADAATQLTKTIASSDTTTEFQYVWLQLQGSLAAGQYISELEFYSPAVPNNLSLSSNAYTAASEPSAGRIALQLVETGAITINTDVVAKMSRDGGATWATAALALSQSLIGPKMYEAADIDLSGLPSGTSMKWQIATANNKDVAIAGVVMQWS